MEKERKITRIRNSVSFKLAIIVTLTLLLLIPTAMIKNLIRERELRNDDTKNEITRKWGAPQTMAGPILEIPYTVLIKKSGKKEWIHKKMYVIPDNLNVECEITPEIRNHSIYSLIAYKSKIHATGNFNETLTENLSTDNKHIHWSEAKLIFEITDLRGIDSIIDIKWNGFPIKAKPGITQLSYSQSGFYAPIEINLEAQATSFELNMHLNGSSEIFFIPVAKENNFNVSSTWADPSFKGAFIPDNHHITPEGFTASWNINEMNRSIPDIWTGGDSQVSLSDHDFGIELIKPVDNYQKSTRAVKYAILFIGLTFLTIFFKEVIQKENIHPVQYLIVGCALVIFYSVLISLAEHVGFNLAYWVSSAIIIGMIGFYTRAILKKKSNAMIIALILSLMYSFLFVVLQISDYALLVGNIGILAVLGMVMYFSRKIDWYNKSEIIER